MLPTRDSLKIHRHTQSERVEKGILSKWKNQVRVAMLVSHTDKMRGWKKVFHANGKIKSKLGTSQSVCTRQNRL